jgi:hypothetical protein
MQSMLSRPIMVFGKGTRPIDSQIPRLLRAEIHPRLERSGARVHGHVTVANVGDTLWLGEGTTTGFVLLGIQLLNAERRMIDFEYRRVALSARVAPGRRIDVPIDVTLPDAETPFVLKFDLVDEGICWFEDVGSPPCYCPV